MFTHKIKHIRYFVTQSNELFYVTTPIFYVNASPHIGHLYSAVIADAICRYQRLRRPESADGVHLCTGTDEHGTKIQRAAIDHNVPVAQYCDDISARYRKVFQEALVHNTDFVRTTEQRHQKAVQHFWRTLRSRGHIYSAKYSGWYCVSDETFLTDSQLQKDPVSGQCFSLESGHPVEWIEETNYMFNLNKFQNDIWYWLKSHGGNEDTGGGGSLGRVRPAKFQKIIEDYLSVPLPDISISRPASRVEWAIRVPEDNTQTVYVWLDALVNYLTTVGYPNETYKRKWPPRIQVIGKDILKFHGIYWPAFLLAAGLEPPQEIFVHSHWIVDGQKMSKSKHNVVDPQQAAKTYTMEGLRYFLLREGVAHSDGNYSSIKALRILNSELADTLGNLLSRVCAKSLNPRQIYPRLHLVYLQKILQLNEAKRLEAALQQLEERCSHNYDNNNFYLVVDTVMSTLHAANNFFETLRPWELKVITKPPLTSCFNKTGVDNDNYVNTDITHSSSSLEDSYKLETIIAMTMDTLRLCGIVLQPLLPVLSSRLLDKLNVPQTERLWRNLSESFANRSLQAPEKQLGNSVSSVLFRRIIKKEEDINNECQKQPTANNQQPKQTAAMERKTNTTEKRSAIKISMKTDQQI